MKVFVYGTLKSGYGNNRLLSGCTLVGVGTVHGYKLYNSGFPVASPSLEHAIFGEVWDIGENDAIRESLDRLEGEGYMYDRVSVSVVMADKSIEDADMYVGNRRFWRDWGDLHECPSNEGVYRWERVSAL